MKNPPYPGWIYRQSAVLPYRYRRKKLEVLLITSRGGKRWVVPKGIVEPGMSPAASAAKEALEEAGVVGEAGAEPLGQYQYDKWGGTCNVEVYPYRVVEQRDQWPESDLRRRRWLSLRKAGRRVDNEALRALIARLPEALARAPSPGSRRAQRVDARPARLLFLFRHAKSSWDEPALADFDRPLAPRGERACAAMQRYMALADVHPDVVFCSAALRTVQTLDQVLPALGEGGGNSCDVKYYRGLYLAGPQAMLDRLRGVDAGAQSVMLVAHNPGMHRLASRLAGDGAKEDLARLHAKFPTGALATFVYRGRSWTELAPGTCELHSLVLPGDLGQVRARR